MNKIIVIGTGYVGLVTGVALAEIGNKVICLDIDKEKVKKLSKGVPTIFEKGLEKLLVDNIKKNKIEFSTDFNYIKEADYIYITVGTPENENGDADLTYVNNAVDNIIENLKNDSLIIMKSTVPIGTNNLLEKKIKKKLKDYQIDLVSNPEFLAQGTAVNDTFNASRIVLGINNSEIQHKLEKLYAPFGQPILFMDRSSAELVKYASNTFLALKVSFINEIANLSEKIGANIKDVTKGMSYDERIGNKFLNAGLGYGGSCFPKDTKALLKIAEKHKTELLTIKSTVEINERQKYRLITKAVEKGYEFKDKQVAVLGLSFKPNTDDIREAPSIKNIESLIELGAKVSVYDPLVIEKVKTIFGNNIKYCESPKDTLKDSDYCFILTEWKQIKNISAETFISEMKTPIIFDGRNCLSINRNSKVKYYGIGR